MTSQQPPSTILDHEKFDDFLDSLVSRRDPVKPKATGLWNEMGGSMARRSSRGKKYYKTEELQERQHHRQLLQQIKDNPSGELDLYSTSGSSSSSSESEYSSSDDEYSASHDGSASMHSHSSSSASLSRRSSASATSLDLMGGGAGKPREHQIVSIDTSNRRSSRKTGRRSSVSKGMEQEVELCLDDSLSTMVRHYTRDAFRFAEENPDDMKSAKKISNWIRNHQQGGGMSSSQLSDWIRQQQIRGGVGGNGFDYWSRLYNKQDGTKVENMLQKRNPKKSVVVSNTTETPEERQQKVRALKLMYLSLAIASFMGFAYYIEHYKVNSYIGVEYFGETTYSKIRREKEMEKNNPIKNPYEIHVRGKTYIRGEKGFGEHGYSQPINEYDNRYAEKIERLPNIIKSNNP